MSLQFHCLVAVATVIMITGASCTFTVCPVNSQLFLSINRDLLPIANIQASSEDIAFNPVENFITHDTQNNPPWCSAADIPAEDISEHYVEVNFTEPIVITLLESSGYYNGYVNNFLIEYGPLEGDMQLYTVNESPQDFQVDNLLLTNTYFTLEQPIVAQRLRFKVNTAVLDPLDRICWELLMYGCTLENAIVLGEPEQPTSQTVAMTTSQPPTTEGSATGCQTIITDGLRNTREADVLVIALPIALTTIVVVLVIVIAGVMFCLFTANRKESKDSNYETVTVHMLNNRTRELTGANGADVPKSPMSSHYDSPRMLSYDVPRASIRSRPTSVGGSSDVLSSTFEIKNPLYSLKRGYSKQDVFIPDGGNDYEMIPDALSENKSNTPSGQQRSRHGSMAPSVCSIERSPDPPPSLPQRTHTYSMVKKRKSKERADVDQTTKSTENMQSIGKSTSKERINESIYNKLTKVASSDPMFQVVYDQPCEDDMYRDIDVSVV